MSGYNLFNRRGVQAKPAPRSGWPHAASLLVFATCVLTPARGRAETLPGTSGADLITTSYTTTTSLVFDLGFFAEYLVVGGGGGGGGYYSGGGGGAGGVLKYVAGELGNNTGADALQLNAQPYPVTVGGGGSGGLSFAGASDGTRGTSGQNSIFAGLTAIGGGGGGSNNLNGDIFLPGLNGGSGGGGGGRASNAGGAGTANQGNAGGTARTDTVGGTGGGGGGGGAGGAGQSIDAENRGGAGGLGVASAISGTNTFYAGGGGGGTVAGATPGLGGSGVGGNGGAGSNSPGGNGAASTGSGGGGGGNFSSDGSGGGVGGSGIVIVRYAGSPAGTGGDSITEGGGYTRHTFTTVGSAASLALTFDPATRLGAELTGTISGSGSLTFNGPGRLALAVANSFEGGTTVSAGTLIAGNSAALGSGAVSVATGATLQLANYAAVANAISGPGTVAFAGGGVSRASTVIEGEATVAKILAGTSAAPVSLAPATSWSERVIGTTFSDILSLTNTAGPAQILELSYAPDILGSVPASDLLLGWRDGQSAWVNAILGNTGSAGGSALFGATGSPAANGILANAAFLGSWGVDTTANSVWAVIDHNSDFAVIAVPEPASLLLAGAGLAAAAAARRQRRGG